MEELVLEDWDYFLVMVNKQDPLMTISKPLAPELGQEVYERTWEPLIQEFEAQSKDPS